MIIIYIKYNENFNYIEQLLQSVLNYNPLYRLNKLRVQRKISPINL